MHANWQLLVLFLTFLCLLSLTVHPRHNQSITEEALFSRVSRWIWKRNGFCFNLFQSSRQCIKHSLHQWGTWCWWSLSALSQMGWDVHSDLSFCESSDCIPSFVQLEPFSSLSLYFSDTSSCDLKSLSYLFDLSLPNYQPSICKAEEKPTPSPWHKPWPFLKMPVFVIEIRRPVFHTCFFILVKALSLQLPLF